MALPLYNNAVATLVNTLPGMDSIPESNKTITPPDHYQGTQEESKTRIKVETIFDKNMHLIKDVNYPPLMNAQTYYREQQSDGSIATVPMFSGSATNVNPLNDPIKQKIIDEGLESYESNGGALTPPISPLQPFTRSEPSLARRSMLYTYNRNKIPVADVEFRKGIRHLFFTRPECYISCNDGGIRLCEQALYDEDFSSAYSRVPHILDMLSPSYITGSSSLDSLNSNWNFLLSNRVQGFSVTPTSLSVIDNTSRSYEGHTVTPAGILESNVGGTFDTTFIDTKYFECYETLRLWMLYAYKRHVGIFSPSFNGYKFKNNFYSNTGSVLNKNLILHPYDRAIDYAATLFDIITNEAGTKIIYWCKYYGIFPISASLSLNNDRNAPITEAMCNSSFRYMYKLEYVNKSLLEFNYNAGIVSSTGQLTTTAKNSLPFLVRETTNTDIGYIGAAGMFVGSPYIVMGTDTQKNPKNNQPLTAPYLRFANVYDNEINSKMNQSMVNDNNGEDNRPISI